MGFFNKQNKPSEGQQRILDQIEKEFLFIWGELEDFAKSDVENFRYKVKVVSEKSNDFGEGYRILDNICSDCRLELIRIFTIISYCDHLMSYTGSMRFANFWDIAEELAVRVDEIKNYLQKTFLYPLLSSVTPNIVEDKSGTEAAWYCYYVLDEDCGFVLSALNRYTILDEEVKKLKDLI